MGSSRTITLTLFTETTESSQDTFTILVSALVHVSLLGIISFGVMYTPRVSHRVISKRYALQLLEFHTPQPPEKPSAAKMMAAHAQNHTPRTTGGSSSDAAKLLEQAKLVTHQTLLQPDTPPDVTIPQETTIPAMMAWLQQNFAPKDILANQQQPKIPHTQPSSDPPKQNLAIADLSASPTKFVTEKLALLASGSSPLVVPGPKVPLQAPIITPASSGNSAPPPVVSMSDLRMESGVIALPFATQIAATAPPVKLDVGLNKGAQTSIGSGIGTGSESGNGHSTERITLPENGKFGVVVVGSSLEEMYPETEGLWGGRLTYTVYLHVGLNKSWILQYSLPASAEAEAAGNIAHLEAPWPTDIVRPNLNSDDIPSDALIVHGLINKAGRFDNLTLAFPPELALAKFLLSSLQQWHFRPASQEGKAIPVEILLIIPAID